RVHHQLGRGDRVVVAQHRDAEGPGVEPARGDLYDGAGQPAGAAFPEPSELVDDDVVADVAPAQAHRVIAIDRPHDLRDLVCRVAVRVSGVVQRGGLDRGGVLRPPGADA